MRLLWALILRFTLGGGQRRFTRFVALASLLGMMLGVAVLIVVLSVMNGFAAELRQRLLSTAPDLVLETGPVSPDSLVELSEQLVVHPDVVAASALHRGTVLVRSGARNRGMKLTGAPESGLSTVTPLTEHLVVGSLETLYAEPFTVILGADMARLLGVSVGDQVEVVLPRLTMTPLGVFPVSRKLRVVGLFEVGAQPDALEGFVSFKTAQRLFAAAGQRGVQARVRDREQIEGARAFLESVDTQGGRVSDWRNSQGSLFTAIRIEKITVGVLLASVILVAAFNLVSMLTMSVTEKRSDIAILQVLGLSSGRLLAVFLGHGLILALAGIVTGAALGIWAAVSVADLSIWLEQTLGWVLFDPAVYYIAGLPSLLMWSDVVAVVVTAMVLSIGASVYPAWRAARVPAAEALNYG
ncbi:MAG: FtsX-like permease family protein [Halieaceae bacterium]